MKKLILSVMAMASLSMTANAVTYMYVKTDNGIIEKYDVEHVIEVYYGEESSTPSDQGVTVSGTVGDYTYVDLGLSVKWATCNVGATKPTEYGDYFAWGETEPKELYSWCTYKWCENKNLDERENPQDFTKYNTSSDLGTVDNKKVLEAADDAATANWGSGWRMPTSVEIGQLLNGCAWEWVEDFNGNGVVGWVGTSKINGNTIFLPAAGARYGTDLDDAGIFADYWSSSLDEAYPNGAFYLYSLENILYWESTHIRCFGHSVRAVTK